MVFIRMEGFDFKISRNEPKLFNIIPIEQYLMETCVVINKANDSTCYDLILINHIKVN